MTYKESFIKFMVDSGVLTFGEFTLKSGRKAPYFINTGNYKTGAQLAKLGEFYAECIHDNGIEADVLFGPAYKGIPLSVSACVALFNKFGVDVSYCFDRKEVKDHGEGGTIIGAPLKGRVVIIDDVISAGTSARESVTLIKANQATPAGILIALDRMEKGGNAEVMTETSAVQDVEKTLGIPVVSIANLNDLLSFMDGSSEAAKTAAAYKEAVAAYRSRYGAC